MNENAGTPKIEFLLCGSATDGFYSQAAMFRLALDHHGGIYRDARVVLCLDSGEPVTTPPRWRPYLERVEIHFAPIDHEIVLNGERIEYADSRLQSFPLADPGADVSFICDADTLLLTPFDPAFIEEVASEPIVAAVIAHLHPGQQDNAGRNHRHLDQEAVWHGLFRRALGREAPLDHRYTLEAQELRCPFYINYGFVAAQPRLMHRLYAEMVAVEPGVRDFIETVFYGQMSFAVAVEACGLQARALPMRYNFPNDARADAMHPRELEHIHLMHYLRTKIFDRQRIFTSAAEVDAFLALPLAGSDLVFQQAVAAMTGGAYPFLHVDEAAFDDAAVPGSG